MIKIGKQKKQLKVYIDQYINKIKKSKDDVKIIPFKFRKYILKMIYKELIHLITEQKYPDQDLIEVNEILSPLGIKVYYK